MIVDSSPRAPPRRKLGGFGFVWLEAIASLIGGNKPAATVQPAQLPSTTALGGGSDTGLYIGLGVGAIAVAGIAVMLLRTPAPKPVAGYRRRRR